MSAWKLQTAVGKDQGLTLLEGTEDEVKAEAARLFTCAYEADDMNETAMMLFADLYITRPDGINEGAHTAHPDYFEHGEQPRWEEVEW
jgi:homogentisate 1,2-dioxygenase